MKSKLMSVGYLVAFFVGVMWCSVAVAGEELIEAAKRGDVNEVRHLINAGAYLDYQDSDHGRTALIWAAKKGHKQTTRYLISAGAGLNYQDNNDNTALMWAVYEILSPSQIARDLINAGAGLDYQDRNYGKTALMWAAERGYWRTARYLINAGARLNYKDDNGQTALDIANAAGHTRIAEMIELEYEHCP